MAGCATLSIGGLPLLLSGGDSVASAMALPGMAVFRTDAAADAPIRLQLDEDLPAVPCRWLYRFDIAEGTAECRFGIDADGVYHYTFGEAGRLRYDPRQADTVCLGPMGDPALLRFALWTAYAMAALPRGAMPVHSSAVVYRGKAVLCLGESGTGKSTHTRLWMEHVAGSRLLNDDSPILRVEEGAAVAYGSPWSGKTPCFHQRRFAVAALLRLEQRPANSIRRLATVEAFTALQPSCPPALAHDEHCTDLMVSLIGDILGQVPVYRMGCRPDAEAALLSCHTIFPPR